LSKQLKAFSSSSSLVIFTSQVGFVPFVAFCDEGYRLFLEKAVD